MANWSFLTETSYTSPPQPGKYWLKTVTVNISSAPYAVYVPNGTVSETEPTEPHMGPGHAVVTVTIPSGESFSASAGTTGSATVVQSGTDPATGFPKWDTRGSASGSVTVNVDRIITSGTVSVSVSGGAVGEVDSNHAFWDWAFANFTFSYVDGHTSSHTNCQYGTTVSDSHTISHITNYYGNTGTPALQTRNQSYTAGSSVTVNASHCAQYPNYINIGVGGQTKYFVRKGDGIVLPTLDDYLFEGWWGTPSTRSGRDDEWLDGRSLGDHGTYNCYAHYMTSPVHEFKDGVWHRWLPPDMNAQSVNGTKTVNNIRSKHSDGTWPLDKPIYERQNDEWVQRKGPMIPPEGS